MAAAIIDITMESFGIGHIIQLVYQFSIYVQMVQI